MRGRAIALVILLAALLIAGCGQKGPLYLPEDEPAQSETESEES